MNNECLDCKLSYRLKPGEIGKLKRVIKRGMEGGKLSKYKALNKGGELRVSKEDQY